MPRGCIWGARGRVCKVGRAHGPRRARSWRARAADLGAPTDKGGRGGGCALRSAPGRSTSTRGRWTLHPRSLFSVAGGQRARAARRFPHPDLHSCGRGGKRLPGRQELQRGKWCSYLTVPLRAKSRGWHGTRTRCGVGLGSGWHGERPGPARCDQEDSVSRSLSRRTSWPRRPASSTISTTSARLQRRR